MLVFTQHVSKSRAFVGISVSNAWDMSIFHAIWIFYNSFLFLPLTDILLFGTLHSLQKPGRKVDLPVGLKDRPASSNKCAAAMGLELKCWHALYLSAEKIPELCRGSHRGLASPVMGTVPHKENPEWQLLKLAACQPSLTAEEVWEEFSSPEAEQKDQEECRVPLNFHPCRTMSELFIAMAWG